MAPPPPPALPNVWLGTWSRPPDRPSQVALGVAALLLVAALAPGGPQWLIDTLDVGGLGERRRSRRFLFVSAFVAAFLSLGYIAFYLRGGPRAAESGTLWLQGRALLHGHLAWTVADPTASFRAKDLTFTAPDRIAGILPPGFPFLLAPAFLLGAPMLVGPLLAAALVPLTWLLARELAAAAGEDEDRVESAGRVAVALSIASAALRYQTAESLPHGAAAFALAATFVCALRARRLEAPRVFGAAGLAFGLLLATQPASAIAGSLVVCGLLALLPSRALRSPALGWACVGALPGIALLLAANHAAVGHAFAWPSAVYARLVATPPEHVGLRACAVAAARLVRSHLTDVDNFEPLAFVPLLLLRTRAQRRAPGIGLAAAVIMEQVVVLAASVGRVDAAPAAGVEGLLAHLLPIEHALLALALVTALSPRWSGRAVAATLACALAGFAVHASHEHARRAGEGWGRPHYEPDVAREAGATHGLLFFDDDEAYELAHDPSAVPSRGLEAVRMRGDDHDRLVYELLGRPPTHRYVSSHGAATVSSWTPNGGDVWRFEAEADFPPPLAPLDARGAPGGRVAPIDAEGTCASDGHALELAPDGAAEATVTIELPVPRGPAGPTKRSWTVTPRAFERGSAGAAKLVLLADLDAPAGPAPSRQPGAPPPPSRQPGAPPAPSQQPGAHPAPPHPPGKPPPPPPPSQLAEWSWNDAARTPACTDLPAKTIELVGGETRLWLVLTAHGGPVALDRTTLRGH